MKQIKSLLQKFSAFELLFVTVSLLVSLLFFSIGISERSGHPGSDSSEPPLAALRPLFASQTLYDVDGNKVDPFDTTFGIYYETTHASDYGEVITVLDDFLLPYHKLFDRHHYYYATKPLNEAVPTALEQATLPRLYNLKYINDHFNTDIEIARPLYELLTFAKEMTLFSATNGGGAFNMFVGGMYDFWLPYLNGEYPLKSQDPLYDAAQAARLATQVAAIPKTVTEINDTITLWEAGAKYYVRLQKFNETLTTVPSISLGATGKGYMADILKTELRARGLIHGVINGGTSTMTFLKPGEQYRANVNISINGVEGRLAKSAITFQRNDLYTLSTSGVTEGYSFNDEDGTEVVRGHIVNPLTGYPSQHEHRLLSVLSSELSSLELDYLTTTLLVLPLADAITFLNTFYRDIDHNALFIGYQTNEKFLTKSSVFPGGNGQIVTQNSEYRETFLDLL